MQSLNNKNSINKKNTKKNINKNNKKNSDNNKNNNEYIVIFYDRVHCYKYIKDNNLHRYYFSNSVFRKIFSRISINYFKSFGLPILFSKDWKKKIKNTNNIILTDNGYNFKIAEYIKRKNPEAKVIFSYRNVIDDKNKKILKDKNIDTIWTFDNEDAKKYNIDFFPQFYHSCISKEDLDNTKIEYDSIFLGAAKDRENIVIDLDKKMKDIGLKTDFRIVHNRKEFVPYEEYLEMIKRSKTITDIVGERQRGLTLRALESIYYSKKLITNNKDIKKYDFYNKNNIFVIGEDDDKKLKDFINSKYEIENQEEYIKKYSYENWVKTLIK